MLAFSSFIKKRPRFADSAGVGQRKMLQMSTCIWGKIMLKFLPAAQKVSFKPVKRRLFL